MVHILEFVNQANFQISQKWRFFQVLKVQQTANILDDDWKSKIWKSQKVSKFWNISLVAIYILFMELLFLKKNISFADGQISKSGTSKCY